MNNLETLLSDLMIEFQYTHSKNALQEMARLIISLDCANDFDLLRKFILSDNKIPTQVDISHANYFYEPILK